jgi:hypothetical protein
MTGPLGDQPPRKWVLTTDTGSAHHSGGGGGGTRGTDRLLAWKRHIAPTLPPRLRRLDVRAQSPGATATTTVDLPTRPLTQRPAAVDHHDTPADADPGCASCGPPLPAPPADPDAPAGLGLDWAMPAPPQPDPNACHVPDPRPVCATCRSNQTTIFTAKVPTSSQPDQVIALGARATGLFGSELVIPTLIRWPTWFDLAITGHHSGAWGDTFRSPKRAMRWSAHDDRGRRYLGATTGGHSGLGLARKDLTFTPALAADASTLTLTFPAAIDGHAHHTTFDLRPAPTTAS